MKNHSVFLCVLAAMMWACDDSSKKETHAKEVVAEVIEEKSDSIEIQVSESKTVENIDIEFIKRCAQEGITSFSMDTITDTKKYLDNDMVERSLGRIVVNGNEKWHLKVNDWEQLICHQWEENENYFLFTLLQQDETCCMTMYLCVSDKSGQLLAISQLGLSGGDGGWAENDWGERLGFGKFKLYHDSYYDEDQFGDGEDLGYTREHEYTELQISLENGFFQIDTLNYIKTDTLIANI
ncbi:hypothetical protein QWY31_03615 [Cytophagales bacterium LB-30]|uniref:Uncharacterized protein n=1 Tax=Shiella aurantiaca TaxID=3058365 RepID=A0ABT8F2H0_9BACT|nr:hypothetical protein [Shiella aurantiaca]MDN4164573.1 hypothetical protein [Shiella aurantiaca]